MNRRSCGGRDVQIDDRNTLAASREDLGAPGLPFAGRPFQSLLRDFHWLVRLLRDRLAQKIDGETGFSVVESAGENFVLAFAGADVITDGRDGDAAQISIGLLFRFSAVRKLDP
jgi:hypothetical protein